MSEDNLDIEGTSSFLYKPGSHISDIVSFNTKCEVSTTSHFVLNHTTK